MKTPTPEEVRNKIATKHGFEDWRHVISFHGGFDSSRYVQLYNLTNEAMRDYAEALYTERIEEAGSELPDKHSINLNSSEYASSKTYFHPFSDGDLDLAFDNGANWMKQAASLVIAKEKMTAHNLRESLKKQILIAEQKDKEIVNRKQQWDDLFEDLKQSCYTVYDLIKQLRDKDKEIVALKESNIKISNEWCNRSAELHKEIEELKTSIHNYNSQFKYKP